MIMNEADSGEAARREQVLSESKQNLRKAQASLEVLLDFIGDKSASTLDKKEAVRLIVEVRRSIQGVDYWTQDYGSSTSKGKLSDPDIEAVVDERNNVVDILEQIETTLNFNFKIFEGDEIATNDRADNKSFSLPDENSFSGDFDNDSQKFDFERDWTEIIGRLTIGRNELLTSVNEMIEEAATGVINADMFSRLRDSNVLFRRYIREVRRQLNLNSIKNKRFIDELDEFVNSEKTQQINDLLAEFFQQHIKDKKGGIDKEQEVDEWPLEQSKELARSIVEITQVLDEIDSRIIRDFDYDDPADDLLLNQIQEDFNAQVVLIKGMSKNLDFIKKVIPLLVPTVNLKITKVVERQEELGDILKSADQLEERAKKVEHQVWIKLIFILHPELKAMASDLEESSPNPTGDAEDDFNNLIDYATRLEVHILAVGQIQQGYVTQPLKDFDFTGAFLQSIQEEYDFRMNNAFTFWQNNLNGLYSNFDNTKDKFLKKLVVSEGVSDAVLEKTENDKLSDVIKKLSEATEDAKKQVTTSVNVKIPGGDRSQPYLQFLEPFWDRAKIQIDRRKNIYDLNEEKLRPVSAETAIDFLSGGYIPGAPKEWKENNGWRKETPSKLASGIWAYVETVLLGDAARETEAFMKVDLLNTEVGMGHQQTLHLMLKSFMALSETFPSPKRKEIYLLGDKLIKDVTQVQHTLNRGHGVSELEKNPSGLIDFYSNVGNQMTRIDFARTARLGEEYQNKEGLRTVSERLLWAQQAMAAMNEPTFRGTAWLSTSENAKNAEIARNVRERNPLTIFPLATAIADDFFVKRDVVRLIAGSDTPPKWVTESLDRYPGESLSEFATRKRLYMSECLQEMLYGRNAAGRLLTANNAAPDSLWGKYQASGGNQVEKRNYLDAVQKKTVVTGHLAEQLAMNLAEYSLEPCKAEGQRMIPGTKTITIDGQEITLPILDALAGPTAIFVMSRFFYNQSYRRKLTKKGSAEGSPGPRETLDNFYSVSDTQNDRYWYIPDGETEGVTLKEAIILAEDREAFRDIPWSTAVTEAERNSAWVEEVRLSLNHWDRMTRPDGIGVVWHNIVKAEPGSSGSLLTFDSSITISKIFPFVREVTYMMQRDKGVKLHTWPNEEEWQDFVTVEAHYLAEIDDGNANPAQPIEVEGVRVTDKLWKLVIELSRHPTSQHILSDIWEPEDDTRTKVTRYASLMGEVVRTPKLKGMRNSFEQAVMNNESNSQWDVWKKLFIGNTIIGSIASGDPSAMDYKDTRAIKQLLSREVWERESQNAIAKFARKWFAGTQKELVYQGIGIFSANEVTKLLELAGAPSGLIAVAKSSIADLQKTN